MKLRYLELKEYIQKHDKIADLGIGKGYYYHQSTVNKQNIVGIDLSKRNLDKLATHSPEIKTHLRDVRETGLPDKMYDLVVISQVIEHLEDYEPVLKEAKRICKDNGYFLIGTPVEVYHKYHFHPVWTEKKMMEIGKRLGEILELKVSEGKEYWTMYVRNNGKL